MKDVPFVPCNDCSHWEDCQEQAYREGHQQGKSDGIDEFADWLVKQGILDNRVIYDGEITDYGKVYAKKFKEQLKEKKNE